jgi:hypothetical protein
MIFFFSNASINWWICVIGLFQLQIGAPDMAFPSIKQPKLLAYFHLPISY